MGCFEVTDDLSGFNAALQDRTLVLMLLADELTADAARVFGLAKTMTLEGWQSVYLFKRLDKLDPADRERWFGALAGPPPVAAVFTVRRNAFETLTKSPIAELLRNGAPSTLKIQRALAKLPPQG